MRWFIVLCTVFLVSFLYYVNAAPTDDEYQAEIINHVSNTSSTSNSNADVNSNRKVKVKHRKDGTTVTVIKSKYKSKTVVLNDTDTFNETDKTLIERDGSVDTSRQTEESDTKSKEVDKISENEREIIITDANGNIISDNKRIKEKEKHKRKEKTKVKKSKKEKREGEHKNVTFNETDKTLIERDGCVDTSRQTEESDTKSKEVDQISENERDANGDIISDNKRIKEKEKHKRKEKTKVKKSKKEKRKRKHKTVECEGSNTEDNSEKNETTVAENNANV